MLNGKRFLFFLFIFCVFVHESADANTLVDSVLEKWHTFRDSEHLQEDYTFVQVLEYPEKRALVLEYKDPKGEYKRLYRYIFIDEKDTLLYEISLGTYNSTTQIDRELGNIGENERLYHLDAYCPSQKNEEDIYKWGSHSTIGFFTEPPELEKLTRSIDKNERNKENTMTFCQ